MTSDLIVDVSNKTISMAVLEDQKLVELQRERRDLAFAVGDIYLGRIKKIMPGLNAAFVDIGYERDAFLHYLDLGINYLSLERFMEYALRDKPIPPLSHITKRDDLPRDGKIENYLKVGQLVLVQIVKEPISTKGPRLTCELSLAGSNLVLAPFSQKVSVSTKIRSNSEKERLKQLVQSIKPDHFSVIIRTSAQGKKSSELDQEMHRLARRWEDIVGKIQSQKAPRIVYEEASRTLSFLRDTFNMYAFESIVVNDPDYCEDVREYISLIAPGKEEIVKLYQGKLPIFDEKGITKQVKALFGRVVNFKGGAYLVIEQTEAMHVVDVNSGTRARKSTAQESTAIDVNMAAAEELARQLRLRDMGGIIAVDFIDMHEAENRKLLYEHMVKLMASDRTRHQILPLSKFGVMQITRQRVRPTMQIKTSETCPTCLGTGKMKSSVLFVEQIEEKLRELVEQYDLRYINVHVHPYVAAYINKGIFLTIARQWKFRISRGIHITPNESLAFLDYKLLDKEGNEIEETIATDN